MKITDAPGEVTVEAMLDVFIAVMKDTGTEAEPLHIRNSDGTFAYFCDGDLNTMWIGFALGHRSRDRLAKIPEQRPGAGDRLHSPTLFCIGDYLTALAETLEAAGVDRSRWQQWRKDGQIVKGACAQVLEARHQLLNTFYWMAAHPEFKEIRRDIKGALRQLGAAVDLSTVPTSLTSGPWHS